MKLSKAAVLQEQFYNPPACATGRGEVALMRAVLEEAVDCFQKQFMKSGRRAQRLACEAEEWIYSDEVRWSFSFVNICAVLGLDPGYMRLKLKRWRENVTVTAQIMNCLGHQTEDSMLVCGRTFIFDAWTIQKNQIRTSKQYEMFIVWISAVGGQCKSE